MPPSVTMQPERADGMLSLRFDQQIKWDLADAKATLPPTVAAIDAEPDFDSVAVVFQLASARRKCIRSHEDRNFIVDVGRDAKAEGGEAAADDAQRSPRQKRTGNRPAGYGAGQRWPALKKRAAPKNAPPIKKRRRNQAEATQRESRGGKEPIKELAKEQKQLKSRKERGKGSAVFVPPPSVDMPSPQRVERVPVTPSAPVQEATPAPAIAAAPTPAPPPPQSPPAPAAAGAGQGRRRGRCAVAAERGALSPRS